MYFTERKYSKGPVQRIQPRFLALIEANIVFLIIPQNQIEITGVLPIILSAPLSTSCVLPSCITALVAVLCLALLSVATRCRPSRPKFPRKFARLGTSERDVVFVWESEEPRRESLSGS